MFKYILIFGMANIDLDLFEENFKKHYAFLVLVSFQLLKDEDVAKDIVQDFFINVWHRRAEIKIKGSFQSYAAGAVRNLSLTYLRKKQMSIVINDAEMPDDVLPDELEDSEEQLKKEQIDLKVIHAVNLLPAERRKIFLAYAVDGLSYAQIAERFDVSVNTVKTQMKRSYAFLKNNISNDPLSILFIGVILSSRR